MAKVFLLLAMLLVIYVLPLVLALSAALRVVAGLNTTRAKMGAALLLSLPQAGYVLFGPPVMFGPPDKVVGSAGAAGFYATVALTIAGGVLWWQARRGLARGQGWIELVLAMAVVAGWLASVDNWIAH